MGRLIRLDRSGHTTLAEWSAGDGGGTRGGGGGLPPRAGRGNAGERSEGRRDRRGGARAARRTPISWCCAGRSPAASGRARWRRPLAGAARAAGDAAAAGARGGRCPVVAGRGQRRLAAARWAALDRLDGVDRGRVHGARDRAAGAVAADAAGGAGVLRARLDRPVAAGAARGALGCAARAASAAGEPATRRPRGSRSGCSAISSATASGICSAALGWPCSGASWASGWSASAERCWCGPGGRRVDCWCVRVAETAACRPATGSRICCSRCGRTRLGFAMVANLGFSGAAWRVRRGLWRRAAGPRRGAGDGSRRSSRGFAA